MTNLNLFSDSETQTMSSREIAQLTDKEHSHVMRDIRKMFEQLGIDQNPFLAFDNSGANGRKLDYFYLPKRECLILASGYNVVLRAAIIDRWIQLESKPSNKLPDFNNPIAAARAWADQAEQKQLAESKVKELQPKAEGFDKFINADSLQGFKEVANVLGMGRNTLMAELRALKILTSRNLPYQQYLSMGLFEVKESTQNGFNASTTYTTAKGIDYIRNKLNI
jgi:phage antirepressor YoqD-like protein